jgi:hypothetical protein
MEDQRMTAATPDRDTVLIAGQRYPFRRLRRRRLKALARTALPGDLAAKYVLVFSVLDQALTRRDVEAIRLRLDDDTDPLHGDDLIRISLSRRECRAQWFASAMRCGLADALQDLQRGEGGGGDHGR